MSRAPRREARLQRLIAEAGLASRREAERWITAGRVRVNGEVVREQGRRADPARDRVEVDGRPLGRPPRPRHVLLYKPRGVVTTARDPHARRTVLDLVPAGARLFPVGRLDAPSEGLLLLTNDGALAQALLHPRNQVPRTYRASVDGVVRADSLRRLSGGLELPGLRALPCEARLVRREGERSVVELVLREGQNRQIRRMLESLGHPVRRLVRTRFGPLSLAGLAAGEWRAPRPTERGALRRLRDRQGTGKKRRDTTRP